MIHSILKDQNSYFRSYLGRYLKQKREGLGLSIKAVVDAIRMPESYYHRLEAGRSQITYGELEALISVLHLHPQEIFEISQIASVTRANQVAKELSENYPR